MAYLRSTRIWFLFACFYVAGVSAFCSEVPAVSLRLATATGETTFHIGERIPLRLDFTTPEEKQFEINMASYDRSGRMFYEHFDVIPASGWADPLAHYFGSSRGWAGGGLTSSRVLSTAAITIPLNLNEWVRFDQPGEYRFSVESSRVTKPGEPSQEARQLKVRSNQLSLHIIAASPVWQKQKLASILAELSTRPPASPTESDTQRAATADLRYLATPASLPYLAEGLDDRTPLVLYEAAFGLMDLPGSLSDAAVRSVQERMRQPEVPISGWTITVLSVLESEGRSSLKEARDARDRAEQQAVREAVTDLPKKTGAGRALTARMLLNQYSSRLDVEMKAQAGAMLASSFQDLPADQQAFALENNWELIRSAALVPSLRKLAALPLENPGSSLSTNYTRRELKAAALKRWYEIDPDDARRQAYAEVGKASPSLKASDLSFLPAEPLSQFEGIWAQALLRTPNQDTEDVLAGLLVRSGTGAATAQVASRLSTHLENGPCDLPAPEIAYLVRFDPEAASGYLTRADASTAAGRGNCRGPMLQEVARYAHGPSLTSEALARLNEPDDQDNRYGQRKNDALIYLMNYGEANAKQPLLEHYRQWTQQWAGRSSELDHRDAGDMGGNRQVGLGENLGRALLANQGWLASPELIADVVQRCVGEQVCLTLHQIAAQWHKPYRISLYASRMAENYGVAQYTAKSVELLNEKIKQFPKGTVFEVGQSYSQLEDGKALEQRIRVIFQANGMELRSIPSE